MSTQSQNPASDSWDQRIQTAAQFLGIPPSEVEAGLASDDIGIEKEPFGLDSLNEEVLRFADFSKTFKDGKGIKMGLVRLAYNAIVSAKQAKPAASQVDPDTKALMDLYGYKVKISDLSNEQLLAHYDPSNKQGPVFRALKERFGDKHVIVLDPNTGKIDVDASLELMADLERGMSDSETYLVNGILVGTLAIGEEPSMIMDEDPMFPGQPLRRSYSSQNHASWKAITQECRQFCRILVERRDINPNDKLALKEVLAMAREGVEALGSVYHEAYLEYRERKAADELPKLKIDLKKVWAKVQDPFGVRGNRRF